MSVRMIRLGSALVTLVDLPTTSASSTVGGSQLATAIYRLSSDGRIYITAGTNSIVPAGAWVEPLAMAGGYECRWTAVGVTPMNSPAAAGVWVVLSSDRTWGHMSSGGSGTLTSTFRIDLRRAGGDGAVLASAVITLEASSFGV